MKPTHIIGTPKDISDYPVIYERRLKAIQKAQTTIAIQNHKTLVFGGMFSDDAFICTATALAETILAEHDQKGHRVNTMKMIFHAIEQIIESAPDRELTHGTED